jgi:pyruvate,water dikinase
MFETLKRLWRTTPKQAGQGSDLSGLRARYHSFQELLQANNDVLEILADLSEKQHGEEVFGLSYLRQRATAIVVAAYKIVSRLNDLTGNPDPTLAEALERILEAVKTQLKAGRRGLKHVSVLPLESVCLADVEDVGGKAANLGEMVALGLPIPPGFALTAWACRTIIEANRLDQFIVPEIAAVDADDPMSIERASSRISALIRMAAVPEDIATAVTGAYAELCRRLNHEVSLAVRSSGTGEDTRLASFAGMHATVLNVRGRDVLGACLEVLASKYSPRAIFYRLSRGIPDDDALMCVCCQAMVPARASGVMFSRHPAGNSPDVLVSAVPGLGQYAVDGTLTPDLYRVSPEGLVVTGRSVAAKSVKLVASIDGGVEEVEVGAAEQGGCLSDGEASRLAGYAVKLEAHHGQPQDIEWAIDAEGRLNIVQCRPQVVAACASGVETLAEVLAGREVLLSGAEVASPGAGCGPVFQLKGEADLESFPEGAVLVAKTSSPAYAGLLRRARGIVTDFGGATTHLAIVAAEFGVPMLVGAGTATQLLAPGEIVTVDALGGRVFRGEVRELIDLAATCRPKPIMPKDSPAYQALGRLLALTEPLNLLNPADKSFRPSSCRTIHDITRYAHETAINTMFDFNAASAQDRDRVKRLKTGVPLTIYVIDLGGGLTAAPEAREVSGEQVRSVAMRALLRGMTAEGVRWSGHVDIDVRGFVSVLANTLYDTGKSERELGDCSYAVLAENYVNFSSRLAYHFSVVDAYCGPERAENYVSFRFKGGAADPERRTRRARFIALVLEELGFAVIQKDDLVNARIKDMGQEETEHCLDMTGRLMGCARQLDVTMRTEESVEHNLREFMRGNYSLTAGGGG